MSIAVFASGSGSNFECLVQVSRTERWPMQIRLLICDQPEAQVIKRAKRLDIPTVVLSPNSFKDKQEYEEAVLEHLIAAEVKWIVLAGYMRLIGPTILKSYPNRIVNIHPSLLPAFPGKNAIDQAFACSVKVSGVTIHFVDEGIDTGPIIAQKAVSLAERETISSFTRKIQAIEHRLYPDVVYRLITGDVPSS